MTYKDILIILFSAAIGAIITFFVMRTEVINDSVYKAKSDSLLNANLVLEKQIGLVSFSVDSLKRIIGNSWQDTIIINHEYSKNDSVIRALSPTKQMELLRANIGPNQ